MTGAVLLGDDSIAGFQEHFAAWTDQHRPKGVVAALARTPGGIYG
jgi:hypothetical protein